MVDGNQVKYRYSEILCTTNINTEMIICNVKCSIWNCNIHVATCLPRLDETCRTDEEVGMFGRIVLLHRGCGRRRQDMLV